MKTNADFLFFLVSVGGGIYLLVRDLAFAGGKRLFLFLGLKSFAVSYIKTVEREFKASPIT